MSDRTGELHPGRLFGFGEGVRRFTARPQRVHGPIPWDDARWWAMRRYRPVLTDGEVPSPPWTLVLPAACGVRRVREGQFELTDGDLEVTVSARVRPLSNSAPSPSPAAAPGGFPDIAIPTEAPRWTRSDIAGASRIESSKGRHRFEHVLVAATAGGDASAQHILHVRGSSPNPHDRHWVSALVQSVQVRP